MELYIHPPPQALGGAMPNPKNMPGIKNKGITARKKAA